MPSMKEECITSSLQEILFKLFSNYPNPTRIEVLKTMTASKKQDLNSLEPT